MGLISGFVTQTLAEEIEINPLPLTLTDEIIPSIGLAPKNHSMQESVFEPAESVRFYFPSGGI